MKCPHCNQEHPKAMKFCPNTGQKLYIKENKCSFCGNTNIAMNDIFCSNCGNRLVEIDRIKTTPSLMQTNKPKKGKTYIGGNIITHSFALLLLLGTLIVGVVLLIQGEYQIGITCVIFGVAFGWLFFIFPNK